MILFKPYHVQPILKGTKIETRRMGHKRWRKSSIHEAKTDYSGNSRFARIRIKEEPFQQELKLMTNTDAKAEGLYTIHDTCKSKHIDKAYIRTFCKRCNHVNTCYQVVWVNINGSWKPDTKPWVVKFELIEKIVYKPVSTMLRIYNTEFV